MRKGGGPGKGAAFEREIAKKIVKAFRKHGIKQRECWRSVLSGGHLMSAGDLAMSDRLIELFPFGVECKSYRRIEWWHLIVQGTQRRTVWKEWLWLAQAEEGAAKRKGLKPLLVLKENRGKTFVLVPDISGAHILTARNRYRLMLFDHFLKLVAKRSI